MRMRVYTHCTLGWVGLDPKIFALSYARDELQNVRHSFEPLCLGHFERLFGELLKAVIIESLELNTVEILKRND